MAKRKRVSDDDQIEIKADWFFTRTFIPCSAISDGKLSDRAFRLYALLLASSDPNCGEFPLREVISEGLGLRGAALRKLELELVDRGLIQAEVGLDGLSYYRIFNPRQVYDEKPSFGGGSSRGK